MSETAIQKEAERIVRVWVPVDDLLDEVELLLTGENNEHFE